MHMDVAVWETHSGQTIALFAVECLIGMFTKIKDMWMVFIDTKKDCKWLLKYAIHDIQNVII